MPGFARALRRKEAQMFPKGCVALCVAGSALAADMAVAGTGMPFPPANGELSWGALASFVVVVYALLRVLTQEDVRFSVRSE
jgi:hypothetical protein